MVTRVLKGCHRELRWVASDNRRMIRLTDCASVVSKMVETVSHFAKLHVFLMELHLVAALAVSVFLVQLLQFVFQILDQLGTGHLFELHLLNLLLQLATLPLIVNILVLQPEHLLVVVDKGRLIQVDCTCVVTGSVFPG